jgi:hypothetical protein
MDFVELAGVPDQRNGQPAADRHRAQLRRRYARFALVGIAGEDDLDAPDLIGDSSPDLTTPETTSQAGPKGRKTNGSMPKQPLLVPAPSAQLREQLIAEIHALSDGESLALWAHRRLRAKDTLVTEDARAVEGRL